MILVVTESVSLLEGSLTITTALVYVLVKFTVCHSSVKDKDPYSACRTFVKFVGVEEKDKVPVPYNLKSDDPIGDPAIAPE